MNLDYKYLRRNMVRRLKQSGIDDAAVLEAMSSIKRHFFVQEALRPQAYSENALPIGFGQTITKPYNVARMTSLLKVEKGMKVLEIGTGSGYQAAVLARMGAWVYSIERIKELYGQALKLLNELRYFRIKLKLADGKHGWPEEEPFDRILLTASGKRVPLELIQQLRPDGIMLMPIERPEQGQSLVRLIKGENEVHEEDMGPVYFVRLSD